MSGWRGRLKAVLRPDPVQVELSVVTSTSRLDAALSSYREARDSISSKLPKSVQGPRTSAAYTWGRAYQVRKRSGRNSHWAVSSAAVPLMLHAGHTYEQREIYILLSCRR